MKRDIVKPLLIVGAALALAFCFDILFYRKMPGISFPLFTILLLGAIFTFARHFRIAIDVEVVILTALVLVLSIMVFTRSSTTLITLNIAAAFYLFALLLGHFAGLSIREFVIVNYLRQILGAPLQSLLESLHTFRDISTARNELRESTVLRQTGRGIAISLPVLVVFIALLSSADLVFNKYINHAAMVLRSPNFIEHATIIVLATIVLSGMFAYALSRHGQKQGEEIELAVAKRMLILGFAKTFFLLCLISIVSLAIVPITLLILGTSSQSFVQIYWPFLIVAPPAIFTAVFLYIFYRYRLQRPSEGEDVLIASKIRTLAFIESAILLGSVNGLLSFFIIIQFTYLFGGARNIAAQGFTYAEYVHRGFFELVAVALLSFVIIWLADSKTDRSSKRRSYQFKALAGGLIGLVILIMVSAFYRLLIYEAAYGYTELRIYTQTFIIILGIIFLLLLYKIMTNRHEAWFSLRSFAVAVIFIVGLNIANPDALIARLNIEKFKMNHDESLLVYTQGLSEDAIEGILTAYYLLDTSERDHWASNKLKHRFDSIKNAPWQSYNISRRRALKELSRWEVDFNGAGR